MARGDGITDRANNYSIDAIRARVMGFNLNKAQVGNCSENNPPPGAPDDQLQIGEECSYNILAGGWFGFLTPGYIPIEVRNVRVDDVLPNGQGYVDRSAYTTTSQIANIDFQRAVAPTPPTQYDIAEGTLFWTFNDTSPYINQRDEWFEVDVRTRLLNDYIDISAGPNQHADTSTNTLTSAFDVIFLATTVNQFTVPYGPGMSVYPPVADRQVTVTVTEPNITVVKEVCNESLSGTGGGPGCTPWVTATSNGDALNTYIYRLTVTNEARSGGVDRAPAYDVTVTDTLDGSDLAYVIPFGSDGLNNDGDGATDGADGDGEGAISDNTVSNGIPAELTFSYTHSSSLLRINPGDSVQLYYRVDFDDDAAPLQTFTNTAFATYDSLAGEYGGQSDPNPPAPRTYGDIGDARDYTSPTASADVRVIPIETQPKRITALSNTPLSGGAGVQGVSIGEEIDYRLNTLLPVALLRNFVIRDELPAGIICSEAPQVDLDAGPYAAAGFDPGGKITPTCTDNLVEWNFGNQRLTNGTAGLGNRFDFEIGFFARVENTADNNDGEVLSNGNPATNAYARYVDETGSSVTQNFDQIDVQVREPLIDLTKSFAAANADAADVLTVTVTATNNGTATAYNLRVLDDLTGRNLTFTGNVGGIDPPDSIDTVTLGANQPIFGWNVPNGIDPGNSLSFTFDVRVDNVVQPEELLDNAIQAAWTSLPGQTTALNSSGSIGADGSAAGMRIGALPNAADTINDYEATAADDVTVPAAVLTKTDLNPAEIPTIGAHKIFQIDIALPEGVTNNVIATDSLDTGGISYLLENNAGLDITYTFQGIATINGQPPSEAALNAFPADGTSGSAVWDIGTVVTQTENDTAVTAVNPLIRINYFARINNDAVTDAGDTLQNSVVVNHTHGETGAPVALTDSTAALTVVEPSLGLAKFVANVTNPGNPPQAGDILRYTLTFNAAGGAPGDNFSDAHDLRIEDSLSLGLVYNGNPTVEGAGNTIGAPVVTGDGLTVAQTLLWSTENGNADIDIVEGAVVNITYDVRVDNSVLINQSLSNSASAQWTSIDGSSAFERNGTAAPAYNDYFIGPVTTTVALGDDTTTTKTRLLDTYGAGDDGVRIGDIVEYELRLGLQEGSLDNVFVIDTLPRGLIFEGIANINGDTTAPYSAVPPFVHGDITPADIVVAGDPTAGPTTVTLAIGALANPADGNDANDAFIVVYRARVLNLVHPQVDSIGLTNTVAMGYDTAASVAKSAVPAGGDAVLAADEIVTYTVDITNNGTAPAYDTVLQDVIPVGMRNGTATITMVSVHLLSGPVLPNLSPTYVPATGVATWDFDTGTAGQYNIPAGDTLRIVYQAQADTDLGAGLTLTNQAQVQLYYSFDDDAVPTLGTAVGVREIYGPSNVASVTFTTDTPDALTKENPAVLTVAVGEPFTYRVTVPTTPQATALNDVRIIDDLTASAADLSFVSVTKVSGSQPWVPVNTGSGVNLVVEDTADGIDIPAGEQIVVDITVVLDDTVTNVSGLVFNNTADYTYNQSNNDPATRAPGGPDTTPDMTIVGPDVLTLEKTGPATMQVGTPGSFTLNVHNPSSGIAWNPILTDRLPDGATGGTCGAGPSNVTAQFFEADGVTPASGVLEEGTDYQVSFNGAPTCEWSISLLSAAGGLAPDQRLIVRYEVELDSSTANGAALTNVAGVTQWFSADPGVADAAPRTYTRELTDGTPGTLDHEDAHTISTEAPILAFQKSVRNVTTGQDPGSDASPGDTLRYTIQVSNSGPVGLSTFSIADEVDRLNATPAFAADSLNLISVPADSDTAGTNKAGGTHGTGLVNVGNLSIGAQGEPNDTVEVVFEIRLAPVITSGTVVLNQAELVFAGLAPLYSDDPNVAGDENPTETLIASAPAFEVLKISTIMSGDPNILMAGETLRYTLTIKNVGTENAVNVLLRDFTPANTTYVANSTTLNGTAIPDPSPGVNPLHASIAVNAPEDTTAGYLRADATPGATNVATVVFDVVVDPNAMNGLIIENQGFVSGSGVGSGLQPEQPSDDPTTPIPDDPTRNVVGNLPLLYTQKTVEIYQDLGSSGIVDPGDVLRYTFVISNFGAVPATGVTLTDTVPNNTTYVANSLRLNGAQVGTGGVLPLIGGLTVNSGDNPGAGIISPGESAVVTFEAQVNDGVPAETLITNQGSVTSSELPPEATDADGVPSNGNQPTVIVVGEAQLVTVTKQVLVVGSGAAEAGGQLEYVIRVTNIGSLPVIRLVLSDDLSPPLGDQVAYINGSGTLNGSAAGVTYAGGILTADYAAQYGELQPGGSAVLRFSVQIDPGLAIGTTITNTGMVSWNDPAQTDSASVSLDVGGTPGSAALNGNVWHDASLDRIYDSGEPLLQGWSIELYHNNQLVTTVLTDANGTYRLSALVPNEGTPDLYEIRFRAPGAGPNTASMGYADSTFTNGPQRISAITVGSGANLQNLNLPIWPNGAVYNSVARVPIAGARLALLNAATGAALPSQCFDDPAQQNQVTAQNGFYKFDLNFSAVSCPDGGAYLIEVTPPSTGYQSMPSRIIPSTSDATTTPFSVPACPGSAVDAVPATAEYCEVVASAEVPPTAVLPHTAGTIYHLHLLLDDGNVPGQSQIFNNFIPIDPELGGAVAITKTSSLINVTRGELVPYTITVTNVFGAPLSDISIVDSFPAGFKYVADSARLDGHSVEPNINGLNLTWDGLELQVNQSHTIQMLLIVGSGVSESEYVNRAMVFNTVTGDALSGQATATVMVIPDPTFDCTDVIGKVFDDRNLNGQQDTGEKGLHGVRVVTARGLIAATDEYGRFHITCATVPDEDRGSNFILKLDERSLPTGYRLTTENPRVQRATRGKMIRFNFGATIHRVVRIDIADGVFEPNTTALRLQWTPRITQLIEELKKAPSVLRLAYLADVERQGLVQKRLNALKKEIAGRWNRSDGGYRLVVETEVFWRRGGPIAGQ
ncbi:MAG: SdrD B-like domain-containing protein [Gammaproteobacteria bacterium]